MYIDNNKCSIENIGMNVRYCLNTLSLRLAQSLYSIKILLFSE